MSTGQRILLRVVSALLGLGLVCVAVLGIGQIVAGMAARQDFIVPVTEWYRAIRAVPWASRTVVYVGVGLLIVGGLLVLVAQLARPRLFTLSRPADSVDVVIAPRAVAQMLRRQAEAVPGVSSASVEVTADVARVSATAPMADPERVERDLEVALTHALKKIPWSRLPRIDLELVTPHPARSEGPAPAGAAVIPRGDGQ